MGKKTALKRLLPLIAALCLLLTACGGKKSGGETAAPEPQQSAEPAAPEKQETQTAPTGPESGPETDPQPAAEDGFYHVRSVEELVEAIHPLAGIVIEPGRYDLTDFLKEFPNARDYDAWNAEHEYVEILSTFDGLELLVKDVTDLYIAGGGEDPGETEIVTQPRYAAVLNFRGCKGVELSCLTLGHTDQGDCSGSVLDFYGCSKIRLRSMDLYGCGVYGISCNGGTGDVEVSNSVIRDCACGPFEVYNGEGDFTFTACELVGSDGGGYFEDNGASNLVFRGCRFGQEESNVWYFDGFAQFENCEFMEPTEYPDIEWDGDYPDVEWEPPVFEPEIMAPLTFDENSVGGTSWAGCAVIDIETLDTRYLGASGREDAADEFMALWFDEDGTGWLSRGGADCDFTWKRVDDYTVRATGEAAFDANPYAEAGAGGEGGIVWLCLRFDGEDIWFFRI